MAKSTPTPGTLPGAVLEAIRSLGGVRKSIEVVRWIDHKYPGQFDAKSIQSQLRRSSVNNPGAIKRHPGAPTFLHKVSTGMFEEYSPDRHGAFDEKGFREGTGATLLNSAEELEELADDLQEQISASNEFAYEAHLRDYLARNLHLLGSGLTLWTDQINSSVEYGVGTRRIDILAKRSDGRPVVIELKLSRGHDRTIGQALYYRAELKSSLKVASIDIILVAAEITPELRKACSEVSHVELFEYSLAMKVKQVSHLED